MRLKTRDGLYAAFEFWCETQYEHEPAMTEALKQEREIAYLEYLCDAMRS